jgi:hypothetical protein
MIIASSPYARRGVLWDTHRRHYGPDGDRLILVAQGASREFNPRLPALERDAASASAEYLANFRIDIESFVSREVVEACVARGVREYLPAPESASYAAFVDPSPAARPIPSRWRSATAGRIPSSSTLCARCGRHSRQRPWWPSLPLC